MTIQALKRRFDELLVQLDEVDKTRELVRDPRSTSDRIDEDLFLGWRSKARNLLSQACGAQSVHDTQFRRSELSSDFNGYRLLLRRAVFLAAKEDYEGGYLRSIRSLGHADLFDDELEQARELQASGYKAAAAVVAGVVLDHAPKALR
jgi:hypothetical protein